MKEKQSSMPLPYNPSEYGVIFDLDGVLVSSAELHYLAWKEISDKLGIRFDRERNHLLRGISRRESLMIILEGQLELPEEELLSLMKEKNIIYKRLVMEAGENLKMPGVDAFLEALKAAGFRMAVASSSKNARLLLKQTGLDKGIFDAVVDGSDVSKSKPAPDVFLEAASKLGIPPRKCIVVEDADAGIEGAKRAGMGTLGLGTARTSECDIKVESIEKCDAESIFRYFC